VPLSRRRKRGVGRPKKGLGGGASKKGNNGGGWGCATCGCEGAGKNMGWWVETFFRNPPGKRGRGVFAGVFFVATGETRAVWMIRPKTTFGGKSKRKKLNSQHRKDTAELDG